MMAGGTPGEDTYTEQGRRPDGPQQKSLVPGHAYSIIQAKEVKGFKLLQMRNPWGNFEWDGDWSDKSRLWTPEMKKLLNHNDDDKDGTFWISFQDFVDNFESLDVCRVRNWDEVRIRGRFIRYPDEENLTVEVVQSKWVYALDVPTKSHIIVTLVQEDERITGVMPKKPNVDMGIAVLKIDKEEGS
jgi:calpain-15